MNVKELWSVIITLSKSTGYQLPYKSYVGKKKEVLQQLLIHILIQNKSANCEALTETNNVSDKNTKQNIMIHLVKVDGTQVEIDKEELEKYIEDSLPLTTILSNSGDKVIMYNNFNSYSDLPVNCKVMQLTNVDIILTLIKGDAIVISLTT